MRITIIIPEMASLGGGQKFVSEVSEIWSKQHDVEIHTIYWNRKNWPLENIRALGEREKMDSAFNLYAPWLMKKLEKQASGDVYNTHLFPANWFGKKPNVWYAHDPPRMLYDLKDDVISGLSLMKKPVAATYFSLLKKLDLEKTLNNVDCFVGNSRYCADYLQEVYGKKARAIYPGVDIAKFRARRPAGQSLFTVARLHSAKRVDLCIKALALLQKELPQAKLRIAGEGPERRNLEALASSLGISKSVSFLGFLTEEQLTNEYTNAYAVMYLPMREPFGLVPLEAGASGKPVIAANEGGCKETVIDGKTGFLVRPTAHDVADAASKLLADRKKAAKMGYEGRKRACQFTWKLTAKSLLAVLNSYTPV